MNRTFLVFTSLLISMLCHLAVFTNFILVFPVAADKPKPKIFFLGPILKQSDIKQDRTAQGYGTSKISELNYAEKYTKDNPFAIKAIRKPLLIQTPKTTGKVIIKSTFEIWQEQHAETQREERLLNTDIKIQPYRSLHFHSP